MLLLRLAEVAEGGTTESCRFPVCPWLALVSVLLLILVGVETSAVPCLQQRLKGAPVWWEHPR